LTSENYQFVGVVEGEVMVIYLDRAKDNEPVTAAEIEVSFNGEVVKAALQKDGTYEAVSGLLKKPGSIELIVSIAEGAISDLLVGAVIIPDAAANGVTSGGWVQHGRNALATVGKALSLPAAIAAPMALVTGILGLGIFIGTLTGGLRRPAFAILAVCAVVFAASAAMAHEGHDHGPSSAATNGNAPQRLPDGSIFLPKATQRLLEVRTTIIESTEAEPTVRFNGRIIADPRRSGVVQSTIGGRFVAPEGGVPPLGAKVTAGQLLGRIKPAFASIDSSQLAQTLAELDQQIALNRQKLNRQETMLRTNAVPLIQVEETRFALAGQIAKRKELVDSLSREEELIAPVDGVIAAGRAISGQVIAQSDRLFEIVDPARPLVEALIFDMAIVDRIGDAEMALADGTVVKLKFQNRSRTLQQQYAVVQFEVMDAPSSLSIGQPVSIVARAGKSAKGIVIPRAALAQAPNGQTVVFEHKEPESFVPRAVRVEPLDSRSVLIVGGLKEGDKIVIRNAPLVNQVR
jgi:hypothetical protein